MGGRVRCSRKGGYATTWRLTSTLAAENPSPLLAAVRFATRRGSLRAFIRSWWRDLERIEFLREVFKSLPFLRVAYLPIRMQRATNGSGQLAGHDDAPVLLGVLGRRLGGNRSQQDPRSWKSRSRRIAGHRLAKSFRVSAGISPIDGVIGLPACG